MEWLFDHLASLTPASVYYTLAGILLLCGLGAPIPEDLSLIAGGYMAYLGVVNVHTVFLVCFAAVLGGDTLAFVLGRYFGARVLASRVTRRLFTLRKQMRVRAYFRKYGSKVIFVGRFLPGLRFSIFFSAGMLRVRPAVFLTYDTLAAALSVPTLVYLAWRFGQHIQRVYGWARRSEYGILVVAIVVVTLLAIKAVRRRRAHRVALALAAAKAAACPVPEAVASCPSADLPPDLCLDPVPAAPASPERAAGNGAADLPDDPTTGLPTSTVRTRLPGVPRP